MCNQATGSCSSNDEKLLVCENLAALLVYDIFRLESTCQEETVMPQLCCQNPSMLLPKAAFRLQLQLLLSTPL